MLIPATVKLTIIKGAKFDPSWTLKADGVPVDFTGCKARLHARKSFEPGEELLLNLTTENGGIALEGDSGRISLWMGATQTALIEWDGGVFQLELEWSGDPDDVDRLMHGSISVLPEVPE